MFAALIVACAAANGQTRTVQSRDVTNATERHDGAATVEGLGGDPSQTIIDADAKALRATWRVTVTFENGFGAHVLLTFMPGRKTTEGTLTDTNDTQFKLPIICTPDQGAWERVAFRTFIATHYTFCFDASQNNQAAGTVKIRDLIKLNGAGTELTGTQYIEILDNDGNVLDTFVGEMAGTRVKAEAPPASALDATQSNAQTEAVADRPKPPTFFRRRARLVR